MHRPQETCPRRVEGARADGAAESRMLKSCLLLVLLLVSPVFAQPPAAAKKPPGIRKLLPQLNLSEAQKTQVQKIMDSGAHGKERREALMKVLTPEQAAKFKTLLDQQRAQQQQPQ